ncbi:helix-hairpin-helix domain-containing protein [Thiothrix nivea]|nr:helix-hairpin-helix domain-containing protein [Thiothrix nivea]
MEQDIASVKYVGPATVKRLAEHGITTIEQLAAMPVEELAALSGIGENTAPLIIASAQSLLAQPEEADDGQEAQVVDMIEDDVEAVADQEALGAEVVEETVAVGADSELSPKQKKKQVKKAKKVAKKAVKKAKKLEKEAKKAAKKAKKDKG